MTVRVKKFTAKKPVELVGIQIPDTRAGLVDAFNKFFGHAPVTVQESPTVQGEMGIRLIISSAEQNWQMEVRSGDWLLVTEQGDVSALPDLTGIQEEFYIQDHA